MDESLDSAAYYDRNADAFVAGTIAADMAAFYGPFLARVPDGGAILDAGCGSGRDSRRFKDRGYAVTAFDASEAMVRRSAALLGQPVLHLRLQDLAFADAFDGVWACASLLHVPRAEMGDVLGRLALVLLGAGLLVAGYLEGQQVAHRLGPRPDLRLPGEGRWPGLAGEYRLLAERALHGWTALTAASAYFRHRRSLGLAELERARAGDDGPSVTYAAAAAQRVQAARQRVLASSAAAAGPAAGGGSPVSHGGSCTRAVIRRYRTRTTLAGVRRTRT
jgi:SAM-dependent methyltransferase